MYDNARFVQIEEPADLIDAARLALAQHAKDVADMKIRLRDCFDNLRAFTSRISFACTEVPRHHLTSKLSLQPEPRASSLC
jgi:hypothetical protein